MADEKISGLPSATPATTDLLEIVDVSDTTDDAAGSSKKVTVADIVGGLAHTFTVGQTLAAATTYLGAAAQPHTLEQVAPASGAGNAVTLKASAAASGNTNGGDVVLTPGAKSGSGVDGKVCIPRPGGTPGTNETDFYHTSDGFAIDNKDTSLFWVLDVLRGGSRVFGVLFAGSAECAADFRARSGNYYFRNGSTFTLSEPSDGIARFSGDSGVQIEILQVADIGTPASNSVRMGAEDVAGTAELIASDEAGNETQLTPHAADGPPELYDETPGLEHVVRTVNRFLSEVVFVNLSRAAICAETGERKKCRFVESLANYNARTGRNKRPLNWEDSQAEKQAAYDAARAAEQERHAKWLEQVADQQAKHDAARAAELVKHEEWSKAKPEERDGDTPTVRPELDIIAVERAAGREPTIRADRDIRKPVPAWLAARGVT